MTEAKKFKDFGIKTSIKSFVGDKIKIGKILNKQILVHDFKICKSNYGGDRLDIQITLDDEKRVFWTSSKYLIESINQVPAENFPFITIIIEIDERYEFS